jgi:NAD(P)-dependent dehydrogenase (short-subunit alcohol dehydrogenase family)
MELKDKTAIITGSTGKLTRHITIALAQAGCDCLCHYYENSAQAQNLVEQIKSLGQKAIAVQADLTKDEGIEKLFAAAGQLAPPQILINSAGIFEKKSLENVTFEDARKTFDLNLTAAIMMCKYFAKQISNMSIAKIINIVDSGAVKPWADYVLYCSSKAGLVGATKTLAKELAPNICVNAVAPGIISGAYDFDEDEKKRQLSFISAARFGNTGEVAAAVKFLIENDYITGQVLSVDGGRTI